MSADSNKKSLIIGLAFLAAGVGLWIYRIVAPGQSYCATPTAVEFLPAL